MPKTTAAVVHATDLDYDVASLSEPLTEEAHVMLDAVLDTRDYLHELMAYVGQAQAMLEAGRSPFEVKERFGFDLDEVITQLDNAIVWTVN
jgi:hypothetical protein